MNQSNIKAAPQIALVETGSLRRAWMGAVSCAGPLWNRCPPAVAHGRACFGMTPLRSMTIRSSGVQSSFWKHFGTTFSRTPTPAITGQSSRFRISFDYLFWNKEPAGYHLFSILWHVLSGVLLYYLLRRILGSLLEAMAGQVRLERTHRFVRPRRSFSRCSGSFIPCTAPQSIMFPAGPTVWPFSSQPPLAPLFAGTGPVSLVDSPEACLFWRCCPPYSRFARARRCALGSSLFLLYLFGFERRPRLRLKFLVLTACVLVVSLYAGLRQLPEHHSEPGPRLAGLPRCAVS